MGYNFISDNVGLSSFIYPLLPPKSMKSCEIPRKFELTDSSSRSSKFTDLGANQKHMCNFLLVISVTLQNS